jgi:tetratricopeptide (TPR) repeat protein
MRLIGAAMFLTFTAPWIAVCQEAHPMVTGVVLENTLTGGGAPHVQVSAEPPGSPTITNSDGTFVLEFPQRRPGVPIVIQLQKQDDRTREDYVVVNDVQLKTFLPNDATEKLTFVICKKHEREDYARLFYKLKSLEAIELNFKRRMTVATAAKERLEQELQAAKTSAASEREELTAKLRAQDETISRLKQDRMDAEAAANSISEALAAGTAGEKSERYQQAMRLFLAGNVAGALEVLKDDEIRQKVEHAKQTIAGGQKELNEGVDEYLLKAALFTSQLRFSEAESEYLAAIDASRFSFEANYRYAQLNRVLHRHDKAIEEFGNSRKIADLAKNNADVGLALTGLGNTYSDKKAYADSAGAHKSAVEVYESLVKQDSSIYNPLLAGALINLGIAERRLHQVKPAEEAFNKALQIITSSPDPESPRTLYLSASVQGNLGNVLKDQIHISESYHHYESSVSAFQKLVQSDPRQYQPELAQAQNNLGELEREIAERATDVATRQKFYAEAEQNLEAARAAREELSKVAPEIYEPDYPQTLTNLGLLYIGQRQFAKATENLEKARNIRRALADKDTDAYQGDYANTLTVLGTAYLNQYALTHDPQLLEKAAPNLEQAVKLRERLAERDPNQFAISLGNSLGTLAEVYAEQQRWDDAQNTLEQALKAFSKVDSSTTAYPMFRAWSRIGYLKLKQGQRPEAIAAFERAQSYFGAFSAQEKQLYRRQVLDTAGTLAALKASQR